jgi:outer membrane protein assembly factor BamB
MTRGPAVFGWLVALAVTAAARAEDWPGFRGPTGQGHSGEKGLPVEWNVKRNIAWKVAIDAEGHSSPIVIGDRVFLTGTTGKGGSCRVLCFDRKKGALLWNKEAMRQELRNKNPRNSYATPTPAADAKRVYAVFSDGGIAALDHAGKVLWTNRDVKHYSQHGLAASPLLYKGLLIMPYDGSSAGPDKKVGWQTPWDKAVVLAVDVATGKEKWRGKRGLSRIAHMTPIVVKVHARDQIVSPGGDVVQGFDPATGKRLWSVASSGEGVSPSPASGEGLVFTSSGFGDPHIRAVRPGDAKGAGAKVVWEDKTAVPTIPSLIYVKPHLFTVSTDGIAQCFKAADGERLWRRRLVGTYSASPLYADGKLYFLNDEGETTVIEAAAKYALVAKNALGERC